jgi:outer membrane protein
MKVIHLKFLLVLMLISSTLSAQNKPYVLTVDQAKDYALQHNRSLMNARDQESSANEKFKEVRAQGLPQIDGSVNFMTYFNYKMNFSFGGSSGAPPDFSQPPFDDGDRALMSYMGSMFSSEPIVMKNSMAADVKVSQLVFSGQYWVGLQTAKIAKRLANQNVTMNEQDTRESIANSYYTILVLEQNQRIYQKDIEDMTASLQHTGNLFQNGVLEATDVDQVKVALNQLRNGEKALERAIQLNYNLLRFQLGVEPDAQITLADDINKVLISVNPDSTLATDFDITNNISYTLTESQVQLSRKQLDMQSWAYAPTIAGYYSYTQKIVTTSFDMTPKNLAGVTMSVPIFSSGMRAAQVSQSKISLDIAKRNQEIVKEGLETQKNQLLFNYQNALENFNTQKENVDLATRVYTSIQNKYNQGMVSSLDLTQAEMNYLTAENNYLSSVLTMLQAQTALDKLYNKI